MPFLLSEVCNLLSEAKKTGEFSTYKQISPHFFIYSLLEIKTKNNPQSWFY
jgi:hypothetical protein